jgi:glycosyltransferase involved in cell wall biosynthesis
MSTLSVISPAYNQEDWLIPFLDSLAAQTWSDFDFIIIDDGSTDCTAELIEALLPRFVQPTQFIRHEKNQGQMTTVTQAFARATGEICVKLDADGVFGPDTLAKIMDTFTYDEQVGIVTAIVKAADRSAWVSRGTEVLCAAQQRYSQVNETYTTIAYGNCFAFRRHIFTEEEIRSRTDVDLSHLARKRGWKIALRKDITIQTRFPTSCTEAFAWGRRKARTDLPTYWHHKETLLTKWTSWAKFAPLGLGLAALLRPKLALLGLLGWFGAGQVFLARLAPNYPLSDRLAGWIITLVRWTGFDFEVLLTAGRALNRKHRLSKR